MMRSLRGYPLATVLVAVLVVSAGCASLGGSTTDEPTSNDSPTADTVETTTTDGGDGTATATPTDDGATDGGDGTATDDGTSTAGTDATDATGTDATAGLSDDAFAYRIVSITTINDTARNVTVRLTNRQNRTASGVVAETVIYAGNTTADDQQIWTGSREIGSMAAGSSVRFSQTVALTLNEALKVEGADGWITIVTTVRTDNGTVTVTERRDVN